MAFFKKEQEVDWTLLEDDFEEEPIPEESKTKVKKNKSNKKKKPKIVEEKDELEDSFASNSDGIYYEEEEHSRRGIKIAIVGFIVIISLGLLGYINTDFDNQGNPYIVPLELHYERTYINQSDNVLDFILDIDKTLEKDTENLPNNFLQYSTTMKDDIARLKSLTTSLSKYVGVPTSMDTYHTQLLNFSLQTQEFLQTLIDNYNDADYEAFRSAGVSDYQSQLAQLKSVRTQINDSLFRNMDDGGSR